MKCFRKTTRSVTLSEFHESNPQGRSVRVAALPQDDVRRGGRVGLGFAAATLLALATAACTDVVELDSTFEESQPVVDAWLTDEPETQTIFLSETQDYYVEAIPDPLTGAEVLVCSGTTAAPVCKTFAERGGQPGAYAWTPGEGERIAGVGDSLALLVELADGRQLAAQTELRRVPEIDSISFQFEEEQLGLDEGIYAQVYARDLPGTGDRYLIRSTVNDTLLNRADEVNLAADAAFDGGTASDGIAFILPIRFGINKLDDDGSPVAFEPGDRVEVEIWSLTEPAFRFLESAVEQIQNGESALFSVPVVSTRGNVFNVDAGESVPGMFSVSAVSVAADTL